MFNVVCIFKRLTLRQAESRVCVGEKCFDVAVDIRKVRRATAMGWSYFYLKKINVSFGCHPVWLMALLYCQDIADFEYKCTGLL